MEPLIINFCPTGMVPTKAHTPHVPVHANEIIEQVHAANELGITVAHLHARDAEGHPTHRKEAYFEIIEGVRKHCPGLLVCASLSGHMVSDASLRGEVLALRPDMASLTLSSLNFAQQASVNAPDTIQSLAKLIQEAGAHPELEVFDLGMINYGKFLIRKGLIRGPIYCNLLFGNIAGVQAQLNDMAAMVNALPEGGHVVFAGIGAAQLSVTSAAIALGYGVRVGLEDNIWYDRDRKELATNLGLLERIHAVAEIHERVVMSPSELGEKGFYNANRSLHAPSVHAHQ